MRDETMLCRNGIHHIVQRCCRPAQTATLTSTQQMPWPCCTQRHLSAHSCMPWQLMQGTLNRCAAAYCHAHCNLVAGSRAIAQGQACIFAGMLEFARHKCVDVQAANALLPAQSGSSNLAASCAHSEPGLDNQRPPRPQAQSKKRRKGKGYKCNGFFDSKAPSGDVDHQIVMGPVWSRSMAEVVRGSGTLAQAGATASLLSSFCLLAFTLACAHACPQFAHAPPGHGPVPMTLDHEQPIDLAHATSVRSARATGWHPICSCSTHCASVTLGTTCRGCHAARARG